MIQRRCHSHCRASRREPVQLRRGIHGKTPVALPCELVIQNADLRLLQSFLRLAERTGVGGRELRVDFVQLVKKVRRRPRSGSVPIRARTSRFRRASGSLNFSARSTLCAGGAPPFRLRQLRARRDGTSNGNTRPRSRPPSRQSSLSIRATTPP